MTTARELAFELSQLPARQRERLLADLPADRRAAIESLMAEVAGMLSATPEQFDRHLDAAGASRALQPFARLNDGQLRVLLGAEHASVQRRVLAAVRNKYSAEFPPAVDAAVAEYLAHRIQTTEIHGDSESDAPRPWWHGLKGMRR